MRSNSDCHVRHTEGNGLVQNFNEAAASPWIMVVITTSTTSNSQYAHLTVVLSHQLDIGDTAGVGEHEGLVQLPVYPHRAERGE